MDTQMANSDTIPEVVRALNDVLEKNREHERGFPQDTDYTAAGERERKKLAKEGDADLQRRICTMDNTLKESGLSATYDVEGEHRDYAGREDLLSIGRPIRRGFDLLNDDTRNKLYEQRLEGTDFTHTELKQLVKVLEIMLEAEVRTQAETDALNQVNDGIADKTREAEKCRADACTKQAQINDNQVQTDQLEAEKHELQAKANDLTGQIESSLRVMREAELLTQADTNNFKEMSDCVADQKREAGTCRAEACAKQAQINYKQAETVQLETEKQELQAKATDLEDQTERSRQAADDLLEAHKPVRRRRRKRCRETAHGVIMKPSQGKSLRRPGFLRAAGLNTKSTASQIKFGNLFRALIHTAAGNRLAQPITATNILLATEGPNDWKSVSNDHLDRLSALIQATKDARAAAQQ
jgi:chromosome segregation ATPase